MKSIVFGMFALLASACGGGNDEPSDEITRIDGPAMVDEDGGGAVDVGDDPSDS